MTDELTTEEVIDITVEKQADGRTLAVVEREAAGSVGLVGCVVAIEGDDVPDEMVQGVRDFLTTQGFAVTEVVEDGDERAVMGRIESLRGDRVVADQEAWADALVELIPAPHQFMLMGI